jgi:hypothetical protein
MARVERSSRTTTAGAGAPRVAPPANIYLPEIEITELPSAGKVYPIRGMYYHPYSFGELKKLSMDTTPQLKKYEYITNGLTLPAGMSPDDLTLADVLFIALLRKLSVPGVEQISLTKICDKCKKVISHTIKFTDIEFDDLQSECPLTVEINGIEMSFSPMTLGGMKALVDYANDKGEAASSTDLLAFQCISHDYDVMAATLEKMSETRSYLDQDLALLNQLDQMMYHGIKPIPVQCANPECKHMNHVELDGEDEGLLVLPFLPAQTDTVNRIKFGVRPASTTVRDSGSANE